MNHKCLHAAALFIFYATVCVLLLEHRQQHVYDFMQAWAQAVQKVLLLDTHPGWLCYAATGRLPAEHTNIILLHLDLTAS